MTRKGELEEEVRGLKERLDMLEEIERELVRRKEDQHKEELTEWSTAGLEESKRHKVERLLIEYQDVFSTWEFDIGRTTLVQHSIDTGDATPIRQPLRRSSPQQREVKLEAGDVYKAQGPAVVIEVVGGLRWKEGDDAGGKK